MTILISVARWGVSYYETPKAVVQNSLQWVDAVFVRLSSTASGRGGLAPQAILVLQNYYLIFSDFLGHF